MEIKIYTTETCSKCKQLMRFLWNKGIQFEEYPIEIPENFNQIKHLNVTEAPVIIVDWQYQWRDYFISHLK